MLSRIWPDIVTLAPFCLCLGGWALADWLLGGGSGRSPIPRLLVRLRRWKVQRARGRRGFEVQRLD